MKTRLRLGAILHFIIAIGHVACLFFLEEAFKAYDILDEMTSMCFGQAWLLYVLTIALALAFAVAGLYALSAAGDIKRLPLQRLVIIAIVVVYYIRTMSQGQVIDIMTYNSYSFTVLQFSKSKKIWIYSLFTA